MRVIITFLGVFPKLTIYQHHGKSYEGEVFAQALRQFCQFERMLVCVTEEAETKTLPILTALNDSRIEPIPIPKGETTVEMWETFTTIAQHVQTGDEVIFDITHGLRSLPFLVFLFAAYLKAAKQISIAAVYYGAYELGKPAPVIDLSEFINMLDWLTATDTFLQSGNSQALAHLLQAHKPSGKSFKARKQQQDLQRVSDAISTISLALQMTRPIEVMQATADLESTVATAGDSLVDCAKPFAILQDRIITEYGQFSFANPEANSQQISVRLSKEFDMISWYIAHQHIVPAATLANEWLSLAQKYNYFDQQRVSKTQEELRHLRNDLAHAGTDPRRRQDAKALQVQMQKIYQDLKALLGVP
jgi:CRISPR-associated DxTHG motif protein